MRVSIKRTLRIQSPQARLAADEVRDDRKKGFCRATELESATAPAGRG